MASGLHRFLFLPVFLVVLASAVMVTGAQPGVTADIGCVCGPKRVTVLLLDFADARHTTTQEYYSRIVREMNESYYWQSYGKMWIVDGGVYGWYNTTLKLSSLRFTASDLNDEDSDKLDDIAMGKARQLGVAGDYVFAVFSGEVGAWATGHPSKLSIIGEIPLGDLLHSFMHEFGHNLGLPDLYNRANLYYEPLRSLDLMEYGEEELSGWSRMVLGWLSSESILDAHSSGGLIAVIDSLESANGTRLVKIQRWGSSAYLLSETRRIDGRRPELGLRFAIYRVGGEVVSGEGAIVAISIIDASQTPTFYDKEMDVGFIVLESQPDALKVKLTGEQETQSAQEAFDTINTASQAIDVTPSGTRVQELENAKQALSEAWNSFHKSDFAAAKESATRAMEFAKSAGSEYSHYKALELRQTLAAWIEYNSFKSDEAIRYVTQAKMLIHEADDLIARKDYDAALQKLSEASQDLARAAEAEKRSAQAISLPTLLVTVGTLIGFAIVVVLQQRGISHLSQRIRKTMTVPPGFLTANDQRAAGQTDRRLRFGQTRRQVSPYLSQRWAVASRAIPNNPAACAEPTSARQSDSSKIFRLGATLIAAAGVPTVDSCLMNRSSS